MALNYLLSPEFQIVNTAGKPATGGYLEVFIHGSRERYYCASDFNGTLYPFQVPLDALGSNVVLADDSNTYDVYAYNRYGSLLMSRYNVHPNGSGGGGTEVSTEITSSDGSINIDKITGDYETTFDLTVARDGQDLLEYVRCDGATQLPDSYIYLPTYTEGTIAVGEKGLLLSAGNYYHVTAHVRATKSVQRSPFYDEVNIRFVLDYGTTQTDAVVEKRIVDFSLGLSQEFEVSTDVMPSSNCELLFVIDGQDAQNGSFQLLDVEAHRVYSGAPNIPSGVLSRVQAREIYQPILTAGENITIENNVISATGGGGVEQVQSDWTESDTDAKSFIRHKPHTKPVVAGSNITIDETSTQFVISATAEPQEQANWAESDSGSVQYIQNKPDLSVYATTQAMNTALAGKQDVISDLATIRSGAALGATATQPADLTAGLATKQDTLTAGSNISIVNNVISATAAPQQQADWAESDSSSVQYIQHKPDLSVYATDSELTAGLATKQDVISDLATIRSGAALGSTSVQPADLAPYATTSDMNTALAGKQDVISDLSDIRAGAALGDTAVQPTDLATVATTGSYADLTNTPSIPTATSDLTNDSGFITLNDVPAQVNADWNSNSGASEILNKPDLSIYAETANLATVATTGDYDDLVNKPTIPAAQVNSDWDSSSGVSQILNKPSLAAVATTGDYDDLVNKPSIPAAQVNADWNSSSGISEILNKPSLAAVATSGDYSDLSNTPSIPTVTSDLTNDSGYITSADIPVTDVEVDGVSVVSQGVASITLPTVPVTDVTVNGTSVVSNGTAAVTVPTATSQLTNDSGFITSVDFPVTDVQVDGTSVVSHGVAAIDLSNYATTQALTTGLAAKQDTLTAGTNVSISNNVISATDTTYTAGTGVDITSGAISVENPLPSSTPSDEGKVLKVDANGDPEWSTGGGGGTNADWTESDPTDPSYIENKPTPKTLTAGANISITEGANTLTISSAAGLPASTSADEGKCLVVDSNGDPEWGTGGKTYTGTDGVVVDNVNDTVGLEAPVDIVAGPGIVIDNPDGNTLRVSMSADYEVELLRSPVSTPATTVASTTLTETVKNFEYIAIYGYTDDGAAFPFSVSLAVPQSVSGDITWSCAATNNGYVKFILGKVNGTSLTLSKVKALQWGGGWADPGGTWAVTKVVGIHRINGGN